MGRLAIERVVGGGILGIMGLCFVALVSSAHG
jgi:hypothetical protein